ncbi:MAG: ABC transporter substrate-binding protein [Jatrophihabitantaceae bacterium]
MTETPVESGQRLTFATLGPLRVVRGGDALRLGGRQQRAVLAALIVYRPAVLSVSRIADEIWGERVPAGHVRTIHTYVHHLREALEPNRGGKARAVLTTVNGGYRLITDEDAIDAFVFERLVSSGQALLEAGNPAQAREEFGRALAMWRGDPLADLVDFPFVSGYARRLEKLRFSAIEAEIDARLALGEHASVIPQLDELVDCHPLRERIHAQRMLALYRTGRQADALAAYRALRQVLDDEIGVAPSAPLRQLHQAMLGQDPSIAAPSTAPAVPAEPARPLLPGTARRPRKRTFAALAALVLVAGGGIAIYRATHWRTSSLSALPGNSVGVISADGSLHHAVIVGANPSGIAYGAGTVWVTSSTDGSVARVDTSTHRVVETIPVGLMPSAVVVTAHDAWVVNAGDGTVSRINTDTNTVVEKIPVGALPSAIAAGLGGLWVANSGDDSIQRIDPITGAVGRPIAVGGRPDGIAVGARAVWVANSEDGTVTEIDPSTGQDVGGPLAVGSGPRGIAMTEDAVWVANADEQSVDRLDPRTGTVVARVLVGDGASSVAIVNGRVWVGNAYEGTVTELDATTNTIRHRFAIGASPQAMVAVGSSVWIASGAFADIAHVGGTLTVAGTTMPGFAVGIDPSNEYLQSMTLHALRLVYDGLVSYRVAGGPAGLTLVPDLATSVPRPSDGGREYSFTLRRGVRFSDGTPVRASDILRGVLRSLTAATYPDGPATTVGIVGAEHCGESPARCDLSRGVVVNDATGSVVFHLVEPDQDFLFKLTYFGQATVQGAPAVESKIPLPGTGPYQISQYRQGETFVLTRNPYFTQWSFAAQPAAYPDTIRWAKTSAPATAIADTIAGRADLVQLPGSRGDAISRQALDQIEQQHPALVHTDNPFGLQWMYLNTKMPPFDDIRVRQAVNYAVDRRRVVEIYGGPARATPACQMLPADFPGYQPYCPYSNGWPDATYAGPNFAKAQALVAASGSRGMSVTVTGAEDPVSLATNSYLVDVLRSLGYAAHLHTLSEDAYFLLLADPSARVQVVEATGWIADYPAASDFYLNLFSCVTGAVGAGLLAARDCNRGLDALADTAHHAEGTDPGAARATWAVIDRKLTDVATMVALVNQLDVTVVSQRVGNYQSSPELGPLLSQIWLR